MKRLVAVFLLLCLVTVPAVSDGVDLSKFTYDELINLRHAVDAEIISRPEWKEVTVPVGEWVIGVDIPAGSYSIELSGKKSGNVFLWGKAIKDYNSGGGMLINTTLNSQNPKIGKANLKNGNILVLTCEVVMSPVKGLGF